jgi:hypothetical protein
MALYITLRAAVACLTNGKKPANIKGKEYSLKYQNVFSFPDSSI